MERLQQQMKFILEVDKVKQIIRQTYLADGSRKENDAEHSWHLALMAVLLKEYANEEVDLAKVILWFCSMILWRLMLEIHMHMIRQDWQRRERVRQRLQTVIFWYASGRSGYKVQKFMGRNLKHMRQQRRNLHMCWTIVSHCF